jgi:hypothetical protein
VPRSQAKCLFLFTFDSQTVEVRKNSLLAQVQGNVSAGAVPQVRLTTGPDKKMWYGILGLPIIFAPAVLVGVEAGVGFLYRLNDRFGVFGELVLDIFFLGNDIKGNGVLLQTNFNAGIRIMF